MPYNALCPTFVFPSKKNFTKAITQFGGKDKIRICFAKIRTMLPY